MADALANLLLRITGESDDGERSLKEIAAELAALDQLEADPSVDIDTGGAMAQLAALGAEISALDGREIDVGVDVDRAGIAGVDAATQAFEGLASAAGAGGGGAGIALRSISFGPFNIGAGQASAIAAGLAIAVGVTLVGALGALAASLGGAVAGLGALGVAFAGVLGPAIGLVVGAVLRLSKIFEVLKAEDAARTQTAQQAAQGDAQAAAAADRRADATQNLATAHERLRDAAVAALREMADAAEAATDAELGLERATLSRESAQLGIREAQLALREFRDEIGATGSDISDLFQRFTDVDIDFDAAAFEKALGDAGGSVTDEQQIRLERLVLNIRDARLREKEATDGVSDAERGLGRARAENQRFEDQGISASKQYAAALVGVRDAELQLSRAMRDPAMIAAQAKVIALTDQLSDTERRLAEAIRGIKRAFSEAFGPGVQALLFAAVGAVERIGRAVQPLRPVFTLLGRTMGQAFNSLVKSLTSPGMVTGFAFLTASAIQLAGPIAQGLAGLAQILTTIAVTAMPTLVAGFQSLAGSLTTIAANTGGISAATALVVSHLQTWLSLFGAIAQVAIAFFTAAGPLGQQFAATIATAARHLAAWIQSKEGRQQIQEFLRVAVPLTLAFAQAIGQTLVFFGRIGQVVAPGLTIALTLFSSLLRVANSFLRILALIQEKVASPFAALAVAISSVMGAVSGLVDQFTTLGENIIDGFIEGIKSKANDLISAIKRYVTDKLPGFVKTVFGIDSPSKVFAEIGRNITQGMAVGLQSGAKGLGATAVTALATPVIAAAPAAPSISLPASAAAAAGPTSVDLDINLSAPAGTNPDARTTAEKIGNLVRDLL